MTGVFDAYADYYDLLYRDKDYVGEARYVQALMARHGVTQGSVLELGCGTGAHAALLADMGYRVCGIDASEPMIERARRRTPASLSHRLRFQTGDARSVRLGERFDAVLALFHVVSYQSTNEDLAATFATAAAHLRAGGVFLFDFWYGPGVLSSPPTVRVRRLEQEGRSLIRLAEPALDANRNLVDVHYTLFVRDRSDAPLREFQETHRMRYLFLPELELLLAAAGLGVTRAEAWMGGELGLSSWQALIAASA